MLFPSKEGVLRINVLVSVNIIWSSNQHFRDFFQPQIHANLAQNLILLIAQLLLVSRYDLKTWQWDFVKYQSFFFKEKIQMLAYDSCYE